MMKLPSIYICLLIVMMALTPQVAQAESKLDIRQEFLRFNELFDAAKTAEDFHASAKILEALAEDGVCSGAVYYNLGNAYYRAGEFGRAILNYRKAKPYRPQDPLLEANLQQAIAAAPGKLSQPPKPWWSYVLFWTDSLAISSRIWIALVSMTLAPLIALLAVWLRHRIVFVIACGLSVLGVIFAVDAALNSPERFNANRAVITGETTARKGIGKDYEAAFDAPLRDGAEFSVLQETNGWTFGHFHGIGDGWVRNEFVAR